MAQKINLFQYKQTISIPRQSFIETIVKNEVLKKKDFRVCMLLLTELSGFNSETTKEDQHNFHAIKPSAIAEELNMKTEDVRDSINTLVLEGIIEKGDSRANKSGYRFTF